MASARGDFLEFVYLPEFERQAKGLFTEEDFAGLEARLVDDPEAGAVVGGTGGVRKLRVSVAGRGRRGGARVIYYYRNAQGRLYLVTAYAKNVADDLSERGKETLKKLAKQLDREP